MFFLDFTVLDKAISCATVFFLLVAVIWEVVELAGGRRRYGRGPGAREGLLRPRHDSAEGVGTLDTSTQRTVSGRVGTLVVGEDMTLNEAPTVKQIQTYAQFLAKATSWASAPKSVLTLNPRRTEDREAILRSEVQIDRALSKIETVRTQCALAGATAKAIQTRADLLYVLLLFFFFSFFFFCSFF